MYDSRSEIATLLRSINDSFSHGDAVQLTRVLRDAFDEEMVIKGPDLATAGSGKTACMQSYIDFLDAAVVKSFEAAEPQIDVFGDTAVAAYPWKMVYAMGGEEHDESGKDIFVFVRLNGTWKAVWRAVLA